MSKELLLILVLGGAALYFVTRKTSTVVASNAYNQNASVMASGGQNNGYQSSINAGISSIVGSASGAVSSWLDGLGN